MSVLKSERSASSMEFLYNARQLQIYTVKKCVSFPKRYTFYVGQQISNLAFEIHDFAKCGNSIYPKNAHEYQIRRDYFIKAIAKANSLVSQIEMANELFGIDADAMKYWMDLVEKELRLLKALLKKDRERYKDLLE